MTPRALLLPALLAAILLGAGPAAAGPWAVGAGEVYAKLSAALLDTDTLASPDGTELTIPDYTREELNFTLLYGLSDRWTLEVAAPLYRNSEIDGFDSASGVGDLAVGLQAQLGTVGAWTWAARLVARAPTGDETKGLGLLPTGTGVWEGELWFSTGRSFATDRGFFFAELAHQSRGSGLTDSLLYRTQLGYRPSDRWFLAWNVFGVAPYSDGGDGGLGSVAGLGDGVRYLAYGPTVILSLGSGSRGGSSAGSDTPGYGWALQLDAEDTENAENLATGVTFRLGVSLRR